MTFAVVGLAALLAGFGSMFFVRSCAAFVLSLVLVMALGCYGGNVVGGWAGAVVGLGLTSSLFLSGALLGVMADVRIRSQK